MKSIVAVIVLCGICTASLAKSIFWYEISKGDEREQVEWIKRWGADDKIVFQSTNYLENVSHHMVCSPDLQTLTWQFHHNVRDIDYTVTLQGDTLLYSGVLDGENIQRREPTRGLPWYQIHGISFPKLLEQGFKEQKFISVRPKDGKLFTLIAERKSIETITVNDTATKTIRVDIRLAGLLGALGNVSYWFRECDFVFIKYQGITGVPGTDPVVYELDEYIPSSDQSAVRPGSSSSTY